LQVALKPTTSQLQGINSIGIDHHTIIDTLAYLGEAVLAWWRLCCLGTANIQERGSNAMHVARHLQPAAAAAVCTDK
jgi:hypothetical protein